jgi:hypothetical protein
VKHGRIQAKDVPELPLLRVLAEHPLDPHSHWDYQFSVRPSVFRDVPGIPDKVRRAKLDAMARRKLVTGCGCGCRGDWMITKLGLAVLAEAAE